MRASGLWQPGPPSPHKQRESCDSLSPASRGIKAPLFKEVPGSSSCLPRRPSDDTPGGNAATAASVFLGGVAGSCPVRKCPGLSPLTRPPMTLGNIREPGVRSLAVTCEILQTKPA